MVCYEMGVREIDGDGGTHVFKRMIHRRKAYLVSRYIDVWYLCQKQIKCVQCAVSNLMMKTGLHHEEKRIVTSAKNAAINAVVYGEKQQ